MENEATNNEILQAINNLNDNTVGVNNSIKELQEYFILKEKREQQEKETLKKQQEQAEKEQAQIDEQNTKEVESAEAEQQAKSDAETETYTELLTDIRQEQILTNQMFAGQFLFEGVITGVLLFTIIWNKLT